MISLEINKIYKNYKQRNLRDFEISKEKPFFIFKKEKKKSMRLMMCHLDFHQVFMAYWDQMVPVNQRL